MRWPGLFENNRPLLDAFRRGDRAALTTVYAHHVADVAALARRGFGLRDTARQRDLIQDTFLRAFAEKARLSYDGLSPFGPWLLRIARNVMIDELRKQGHAAALPSLLDAPDDGAPGMGSPEDELAWKSLRESAKSWRATLTEPLQSFVRLRFEEERSQADVAAAMGVTRRAVRTLEEQARSGLRRHLRQRGLWSPWAAHLQGSNV